VFSAVALAEGRPVASPVRSGLVHFGDDGEFPVSFPLGDDVPHNPDCMGRNRHSREDTPIRKCQARSITRRVRTDVPCHSLVAGRRRSASPGGRSRRPAYPVQGLAARPGGLTPAMRPELTIASLYSGVILRRMSVPVRLWPAGDRTGDRLSGGPGPAGQARLAHRHEIPLRHLRRSFPDHPAAGQSQAGICSLLRPVMDIAHTHLRYSASGAPLAVPFSGRSEKRVPKPIALSR